MGGKKGQFSGATLAEIPQEWREALTRLTAALLDDNIWSVGIGDHGFVIRIAAESEASRRKIMDGCTEHASRMHFEIVVETPPEVGPAVINSSAIAPPTTGEIKDGKAL